MSKRKDVIRVGDLVRIITPEIFIRCGYNETFQESSKEVEEQYAYNILEFMEKIGFNDRMLSINPKDRKLYKDILRSVTYAYRGKRMKYGNERKIYTENVPTMRDKVMRVVETFVCKTGLYCPPWSSYDSFTGECDGDSGGLKEEKTHVILSVRADDVMWFKDYGTHQIQKCFVEKLHEN